MSWESAIEIQRILDQAAKDRANAAAYLALYKRLGPFTDSALASGMGYALASGFGPNDRCGVVELKHNSEASHGSDSAAD